MSNKRRILKALLSLVLTLVIASCAHDNPVQNQPASNSSTAQSTPSTQDAIIGAWERIPLPDGVNKTEPWPLRYQYFAIMNDGRIGWVMASQKQEGLTGKELIAMLDKTHWHHYVFDKGCIVITYADDPGKEGWLMRTVTENFSLGELPDSQHQKGDLLMTKIELVNRELKPVYYRHLRRLPD